MSVTTYSSEYASDKEATGLFSMEKSVCQVTYWLIFYGCRNQCGLQETAPQLLPLHTTLSVFAGLQNCC